MDIQKTLSSILLDGGAGYNIYTTEINYPVDSFEALSSSAKVLVRLGMLDLAASGYINPIELVPDEWNEFHRELFHRMSDEEKIDVCAFVTAIIHEFLHHMDLLRTPFGASLHEKLCREFVNFERHAPTLLEEPISFFNQPFADWCQSALTGPDEAMRLQEGSALDQALVSLRGTVAFDEFRRGTMPRHVEEGWNGNTKPLKLAGGRQYEKVTINQVWVSIRIKDGSYYLSPNEIIEGRTLATCLLYLLHLIGEDSAAINVIKKYIDRFNRGLAKNLSLLEILAGQDVATLLKEDISTIKKRLWETVINGWYSLHAPVSAEKSDILQSMTARCTQMARVMRDTDIRSFSTINKFLSTVEDYYASQLNARPIADSLSLSADRLGQTISACQSCKDAELRSWYSKILKVIQNDLIERVADGYELGTGLPPDGNPVRWSDDGAIRCVELPAASERVHEWYALRQLLITKRGRADEKIARLRGFFEI